MHVGAGYAALADGITIKENVTWKRGDFINGRSHYTLQNINVDRQTYFPYQRQPLTKSRLKRPLFMYVFVYLSISSRRYANCFWSFYSYKLIIIFCLKFHECNRLSKSASVGHDIMREAGHCNYRFVHEMALWASMAIIPIAWETAHAKSSGLRTAHYSLKKDAVQQIWW